MPDNARMLIITGDGKGKTTAAMGLTLRAFGHGKPVRIIQFIKGDDRTGELAAIGKLPGVELIQTGKGFLPKPDTPAFTEHSQAAEAGLKLAEAAISSGEVEVLVLDEICVAVSRGLLPEERVLEVLSAARPEMILVLTGRGATPGLIAAADTVSEVKIIKHGYQIGIPAQIGVEF